MLGFCETHYILPFQKKKKFSFHSGLEFLSKNFMHAKFRKFPISELIRTLTIITPFMHCVILNMGFTFRNYYMAPHLGKFDIMWEICGSRIPYYHRDSLLSLYGWWFSHRYWWISLHIIEKKIVLACKSTKMKISKFYGGGQTWESSKKRISINPNPRGFQ